MTALNPTDASSRSWTPLRLLTATLSFASVAGRASASVSLAGAATHSAAAGGRSLRQHEAADGIDAPIASAKRVQLPKVTLMLSNFARPENVEHIVERVSKYELVDEILVWDVRNPETRAPNITHFPKTSHIYTPEMEPMQKWGMLTRLKGCLLAQNDWVFFQDDDLMISEQSIAKLIETKQKDPDHVTCLVGRPVEHDANTGRFHYAMKDVTAPALVPICLPHAMLTDQRFCREALRKAPMMEDIARQGRPYWSAEDIWHSLVAINTTSKMHQMVTTPLHGSKALPSPHGIHSTKDPSGAFDWKTFRTKFTHAAVTRLHLDVDLVTVHLQAKE